MDGFEGKTFREGGVEYTIHEHIAVLHRYDNEGRETTWSKEVNLVSWNDGPPKVDIRDWSEDHRRMSRGIVLTEEEADKLVMAFGQRMMAREKHAREKDSFER